MLVTALEGGEGEEAIFSGLMMVVWIIEEEETVQNAEGGRGSRLGTERRQKCNQSSIGALPRLPLLATDLGE